MKSGQEVSIDCVGCMIEEGMLYWVRVLGTNESMIEGVACTEDTCSMRFDVFLIEETQAQSCALPLGFATILALTKSYDSISAEEFEG